MKNTHVLKIAEKGRTLARVIHTEKFAGTDLEADNRLSDLWNKHVPGDGTRYRATSRRIGERSAASTIG